MKYTRNKFRAFTLVELIVVITILAVLGTIAFISLQGFSLSARDAARINDIKVIEKGLTFYRTKNSILPLPDNTINITASGTTIGYQGYTATGMLTTIQQSGKILDPLLDIPYTYFTNSTKESFQILGYFEKNGLTYNGQQTLSLNIDSAYGAILYSDMFPKSFGDSLGILTQTDNSPIIDITISSTSLDIDTIGTDQYKIHTGRTKELIGGKNTLGFIYGLKNKEAAFVDDSLVGYWDMETLSPSNQFKDLSSTRSHGDCYGESGPQDCISIDGTAQFNGVDEYVELIQYFDYFGPSGSTILISGTFYDGFTTHASFIGNYSSACGNSGPIKGIGVKSTVGNKFHYRDYSLPGGGYPTSDQSIISNKQYKISTVYQRTPSTLMFYIDDVKIEINRSPLNPDESLCPFRFGRSYSSMGDPDFLKGEIDYIRIYNRVLSESEINSVHELSN